MTVQFDVAPEAQRLAAVADTARVTQLERSGLLHVASDPAFDRFARLAAAVMGTPVSFVSLVGMDGIFAPGMVRLEDPSDDRRSSPLEDSFCQYAISTGEPLLIEDARADALVRDTPLVRSGEVRSYAGIPLRTEEGDLLGTLCVLDRKPRAWLEGEVTLLQDLTVTVQREIQYRLHTGRTVGARGVARRMADEVERLTDATRALVERAEEGDDARLHRLCAVTSSRLDTVRKLARDLHEAATDAVAAQAPAPAPTDLRQAVARSVAAVRGATRTTALHLDRLPAVAVPVAADLLTLESAITHLLVSALHRSGADAAVRVELVTAAGDHDRTGATAEFTVHATGCRMPATELARIVSRLHEATLGHQAQAAASTTAAIQMVAGALAAQSGPVRGTSSERATTLSVHWPLHVGPQRPGGDGIYTS